MAKAELSCSFSEMIYATQSVITNDCYELRAGIWQRVPECCTGRHRQSAHPIVFRQF